GRLSVCSHPVRAMSQLSALILTLVLELAVAMPLALLTGWVDRASWRRLALLVVAASLLTHPLAWFVNTTFLGVPFVWRATGIELGVSLGEGALLAWVHPMRWW